MPSEGHKCYSETLLFPSLLLRAMEPKGEERGHTQLAAGRSLAGRGLDMVGETHRLPTELLWKALEFPEESTVFSQHV